MAPRHDGWDDEWYPPSQPRPVKDGIKAKTTRGTFGSSWWAKRWIAVLEAFQWGSRLQRGRSYARRGQVVSIDIGMGHVAAKVQGSAPRPYKVSIAIAPLTDAQWERAIDGMAQQAIFAAKLLSSEMPQDIEDAFKAAGVPLFPTSPRDIAMECSCPDYAVPCKHIAAVYYLLGERFDEDPFLIFYLRGCSREQIVDALRARRAAATAGTHTTAVESDPVPDLADLLATFYTPGPELDGIPIHITAPEIEAALLRRLGPAPADADPDLRACYRAMTADVLDKLFGEE